MRCVLECMGGEVLPVFHNRLVLENLTSCHQLLRMLQGRKLIAHLPNIFFGSQQLLLTPSGEHAELRSHETDLPCPPPYDSRGATIRDELIQLLCGGVGREPSRSEAARPQCSMPLTITDRWTHFSTNISSSSVSGI